MPKLSIITISYNNKVGLERTVISVIGQTFTDFEYIVIDGASNDGSADILKENTSKIDYWVSEKDSGIYNAMNKGIQKATGEYCLFLNSGDYLYKPDTLENVFAHNYNEDIIYGNMMIEQASGTKKPASMPDVLNLEHFINDTLWHPISFIKRELFIRYGYYREDLKVVSDYDFFLKTILIHKVTYRHILLVVSVFLMNGISSDSKNKAMIEAERKMVQLEYFSETEINTVPKIKPTKRNILKKIIDRLTK